jgi:hypothetical protein
MKVDLQDRRVFVRLTNEGVGALHDLVPPGTSFSALVAEEKPYGLWIVPEGFGTAADDQFVLVKWGYLQTVTVIQMKREAGRKN